MPRFAALLALTGALLVTACDDQPTSPPPGQRPSMLISDANHGGDNKNVFFLPPLVANPSGSPFFKAGEFNPNLTSAVIRICHIVSNACNETVASFGAGQVTGPITIASDHYLASWHTDQSSPALVVGQPYRIEVFPDGDLSAGPIAWADVAVASSMKELKNLNTNETIGLIDGRTLPIKVRFQNGVRCESDNCSSQRVTNTGATVVLQSGNGALLLQSGWLPPGVSEVTVTLQRHETGSTNDCVGNAAFTGPGLVAQREACLQVTTDPVLLPGPTTGIQRPAFVYLCTESDEEDPLHEFLQVIKADDGRPLEALKDVSHQALLALGFEPSCEGTAPPPIGLGSNPLIQLASRGLRAITRPLGRLLDVKPLYAIDLGQGGEIGLFGGFSYFTLGVQANAAAFGSTPETAPTGSILSLSVQVTSLNAHTPGETESGSLAGIDVTFAVTDGDGGLTDPDDDGEGDPVTSLTVQTNSDGVATVDLEVASGTNVVEAVAEVGGDPVTLPVTFAVTGVEAPGPSGIFAANFASDPLDAQPTAPTVGTWDFSGMVDGTALVRASVGDLTRALDVTTPGAIAGAPLVFARVAGTAQSTGTYIVRWRSLTSSGSPTMNFTVRSSDADILAGVGYQPGGTLVQFNGEGSTVVGTWTANVSQLFELTIDLTAQTVSLRIDGESVVPGFPIGYVQSSATDLASLIMDFGGTGAYGVAWDDIEIAAAPPPIP